VTAIVLELCVCVPKKEPMPVPNAVTLLSMQKRRYVSATFAWPKPLTGFYQLALSLDDDAVSIPSDDEEAFHNNKRRFSLTVEVRSSAFINCATLNLAPAQPSSPVNGDEATAVASPVQGESRAILFAPLFIPILTVRSSALLSPLPELESLMFSIRLTSPALAPVSTPALFHFSTG
jgi:hypothetical protein